jgi:hypothetical protein
MAMGAQPAYSVILRTSSHITAVRRTMLRNTLRYPRNRQIVRGSLRIFPFSYVLSARSLYKKQRGVVQLSAVLTSCPVSLR